MPCLVRTLISFGSVIPQSANAMFFVPLLVTMGIAFSTPALAAGKSADSPDNAAKPQYRKVLFLGNSITLHGPKEDIGWTGNWGMAASAAEKDYVHIVTKALAEKAGAAPETLVKNIADFERQYDTFDINAGLKDELDFNADLVVFAFGENVPVPETDEAKAKFRSAVDNLLGAFKARGNPRLVVRGCFWADEIRSNILKQAAQEVGATYVDLSKLAPDESNYARSERAIAHNGVAGHPGDKGMKAIADAILGALEK